MIDSFQLEEERLLARGRTKIPGLKVRMELAWQKEREEQQKLLQETATLARDLQQTLLEVIFITFWNNFFYYIFFKLYVLEKFNLFFSS